MEAVSVISMFILPGYIGLSVANMFAPRDAIGSLQSVLKCMAHSLVVSAFLITLFAKLNGAIPEDFDWLACAAIAVIAGCIYGLLLGLIRRKNCFRWLIEKLGLNVNTSSSPWDFKFSGINGNKLMKVTLADGTVIRGFYSNDSNASTVADSGTGLYLERCLNEEWDDLPGTDGVYISGASIAAVEFYDEGDENGEHQ